MQIYKTTRGLPVGLMRREFNNARKDAFANTADRFHRKRTHARFTHQHANEAGYTKRRGEGLPRGSKRFKRSYFGRKLAGRFGGGIGQALPLVKSGDTRRRSRRPRIKATNKGARVTFNLPALNFRNSRSQVKPRDEFNRITPEEQRLATDDFENLLAAAVGRIQRFKQQRIA